MILTSCRLSIAFEIGRLKESNRSGSRPRLEDVRPARTTDSRPWLRSVDMPGRHERNGFRRHTPACLRCRRVKLCLRACGCLLYFSLSAMHVLSVLPHELIRPQSGSGDAGAVILSGSSKLKLARCVPQIQPEGDGPRAMRGIPKSNVAVVSRTSNVMKLSKCWWSVRLG